MAADERSSEERAYDKGVAANTIQTRLDAHAERLAAINGSIDRTRNELVKIHETLDVLCGDMKTRAKVEEALARTVTTAAAKQVTTRSFVLGLVMMMISLGALYLGAK